MAEIVLYQIPISHFCEKIRWALDYKRVPYRAISVNPLTRRQLEAICATKQVPVIQDGERVVCDSSEIVMYLDDTYPDPPLIPPKEPERGECLTLERIADEQLGPAVRRIAYATLFEDPALFAKFLLPKKGVARLWNPVRRRIMTLVLCRHFGITREGTEADRARLAGLLKDLQRHISGRRYFVGDTMTIADIALASLLSPLEIAKEFSASHEFGSLFRWMRELRAENGRRSMA